jgi:hypothetical protein
MKEYYFMATYKKWNGTEIDFIQNNHNILCDEALAVKLSQMTGQNITTAMVRRQRRKLALKKPRGRPSKIAKLQTATPTSGEIG